MQRWIVMACAGLTIAGCSDQVGPQQGTERGACYPNDSCNAGLTCLSHFCVRVPDARSAKDAKPVDGSLDLRRADTLLPPPPCTTNADCPPGTICNKGTCIPGKSCTSDADCVPGQTCVKNRCIGAKPCMSDKDCPPGLLCKNGSCVVDKPKPDAGAPDLMSMDQSVPDQSVPDQSVPDQSVPDQSGSDQ